MWTNLSRLGKRFWTIFCLLICLKNAQLPVHFSRKWTCSCSRKCNQNLSRLATQGPNLEVTIVTTAITLDEVDKDQFRTRLRAKHGDNLELDFQVDEDILGGAIVQVGDKIIDGSVLGSLMLCERI